MKNAMLKTTFREIHQSLGRYLAILAIVALGVGIFTGLKVTKPFMVSTIEHFFEKYQLYDFQLVSTYGFEHEDVEYLRQLEQVRSVCGSYTYDVLIESGDSDAASVFKVHSLLEDINGIEIVEGRMPERVNECVVDATLYGPDMIGQVIRVSDTNEEDTLDVLKEKEYIVCGIANASTYVQFERGNTSLGSGKISGFMYVLSETFDSEIFTEIYVKLNDDYPLYSEEYETYVEEMTEVWEDHLDVAIWNRFERVINEAQTELNDAKEEFEIEKADAQAELFDAEVELSDAAKEISDGKQKIADGKREIRNGYTEVEQGERDLESGADEIESNKQLLETKEQELIAGIAQVEAGQKQLDEQLVVLKQGEAELDASEQTILAEEQKIQVMENQLQTGMIPEEQRPAVEAAVAEGKIKIQAAKEQIAAKRTEIQAGYVKIQMGQAQLDETKAELEIGCAQIEEGKAQLILAEEELIDGREELRAARRKLADAEQEIADAETELAEGEADYQDGLREYQEGLAEFETEIADAEMEIADAQKEIDELEEPKGYLLGRDTNVGYVCLENDSQIVADVAGVLPVFFFLIAALVCMTTMNRMVEEQRTQIGTMKALGYSDGKIMGKYLFYAGSAAGIGCTIGYIVGTTFLAKTIWWAYGMMYISIPLEYSMNWPLILFSFAGSMLSSVGVTWYSCKTELTNVAASLMRPKAPKTGKRVFLENIPFIWKRLSFLVKVSVRNVLRYKKRFFMMIVGISGCMGLLVTGFGIQDSISDITNIQYDEITVFDMSVTFRDGVTPYTMAKTEKVIDDRASEFEYFIEGSVDLNANGFSKSIYYVVPECTETFGSYIDLHTTEGESIPYPGKGEAVLSHKIAQDFGIEIGDTVQLVDGDHNEFTVTISNICQNFVFSYIFFNAETCEEKWKTPEYQTIYMNVAEDVDSHELAADLMGMDEVANATINQDVKDRFNNMMKSMDFIVVVIIFSAAALAFIVLFNLTNINITERIREIATIKVLGFTKKETAAYVFRENIALTAIGAFLGLFLGKVFHRFVMSCINIDMVAFDVRINPISYVYSVLLTFVFAWIVNLFMQNKLDKISMTESLKSVD